MRRLVLFTTKLSLITLPIVSTVACGYSDAVGNRNQNEAAERIFVKTSLNDVETSDFERGEHYSASQLGIENIFSDDLGAILSKRYGGERILGRDFFFTIRGYDDAEGKIAANFGFITDSGVVKRFLNIVQVSGFRKVEVERLIKKIVSHLPTDEALWTDLDKKVRPSYFAKKKFWSTDQLGISRYFQFRNADHWVKVLDYEDETGELLIELIIELDEVEKSFLFKVAGFATTKLIDLLRIK